MLRLLEQDKTSVLIDGRARADGKPRVKNAVWIPLRDASRAKDDGRLPMTDHNTRIFVVAGNGEEARNVAEAIVHDAFHNVTFLEGTIADLPELFEESLAHRVAAAVAPDVLAHEEDALVGEDRRADGLAERVAVRRAYDGRRRRCGGRRGRGNAR